jgi:hypothetical protein
VDCKLVYLTLCTFYFEINESCLSDKKCLIQNVVSPHCSDKRMSQRCTRRSLPNYFDIDVISLECKTKQHSNLTLVNERKK